MSARTLSCRELIEFLADYLDAALPPAQQAAFEAHLALCPDCVDYLASYRETIRLGKLAFSPDPELPEDVPAELIDAILAARERR
jgi:anti-sigma factor RsiW